MNDENKIFGPVYDEKADSDRIKRQHAMIRSFMLNASSRGIWKSLGEIEEALKYPQASISAQLRHLRKKRFGSYRVLKKRRDDKGQWEYLVLRPGDVPVEQLSLFQKEAA